MRWPCVGGRGEGLGAGAKVWVHTSCLYARRSNRCLWSDGWISHDFFLPSCTEGLSGSRQVGTLAIGGRGGGGRQHAIYS